MPFEGVRVEIYFNAFALVVALRKVQPRIPELFTGANRNYEICSDQRPVLFSMHSTGNRAEV
jgi:hypothetical protein